MKHHLVGKMVKTVLFVGALLAIRVSAQNAPSTAVSSDAAPAASQPVKATPSANIADVLKMLDAGVSKDVVKTYIETSSGTALTSADLIALKDRGVSDELTMALLKRGAATALAAAPGASSTAGTKTYIINTRGSGRLDPEGYDYFQHYYLYPRTLANVNQTLGYNAAYYGYNLGQTFVPGYGPRRFANRGPF